MAALGVAGLVGACSLGPDPSATPPGDSGVSTEASTDARAGGDGGRASSSGGAPDGGAIRDAGPSREGGPTSGDGGRGGGRDGGQDAAPDADVSDGTALGVLGHPCAVEQDLACAGHAQTERLVCQDGTWQSNGSCAPGTLCESERGGYTGTCLPSLPECAGKAWGTPICRDARPDVCGPDGVNTDEAGTVYKSCKNGCADGRCIPPSCIGLSATCGATDDESCCRTLPVQGGTFYRTFDTLGTKQDVATVSDYALDRFEVTVGRFRKFVTAWIGGYRPSAGAGVHVHLNAGSGLVEGSGFESGWDGAWAAGIPSTSVSWNTALACDTGATWTATEAPKENRPINCVTWYEAAAFAIWDGGFLPSELEWEYASAGGSAERVLPWARPSTSLVSDCSYANYQGAAGNKACVGSPSAVGAYSPKGDGLFGHADQAGNVAEWVLDWYAQAYTSPCDDCVASPPGTSRAVVNGDFRVPLFGIQNGSRDAETPDVRSPFIGFRVARLP